jgi:hypothetical protein
LQACESRLRQISGTIEFSTVREPSDERTGVFTSGIVSTGQGWKIAHFHQERSGPETV